MRCFHLLTNLQWVILGDLLGPWRPLQAHVPTLHIDNLIINHKITSVLYKWLEKKNQKIIHNKNIKPPWATKKHQFIIMITTVLYWQLKASMIITICIDSPWVTVKYPKINHNIHQFSMSNRKVSQNKSQYALVLNE